MHKITLLVFGITFIFLMTTVIPLTLGYNFKSNGSEIKDVKSSERNNNLMDYVCSIKCNQIHHIGNTNDLKSIIWDNGGPADDWILVLSQLDEVFPFNAQVADDFIFEDDDMDVLGVRWWGNFWGVGQPINPVDFNIFFYADDGTGNAPTGKGMENPESTALASYFIQNVSSVNDSGQRFYSADLPTPFNAVKGEKYWLVVQAVFEILPKWGRVTNNGTIHLSPSMFGCPLLEEPFWTDLGYGDVAWYLTGGTNEPPDAPIITGPTKGRTWIEYEYNFSISDPEGDAMHIRVDWGSGIPGKWDGPFPSGSIIKYNYTWKKKGTYTIKAQTKDSNGLQSDWGQLTVTMPRDKAISNSMILWFLERYPMLCRLIGNVFYFYQW